METTAISSILKSMSIYVKVKLFMECCHSDVPFNPIVSILQMLNRNKIKIYLFIMNKKSTTRKRA